MKIAFTINGEAVEVDTDPQTPILWVVRDELQLKATKYGCGIGLCGACTLHIDGEAHRACTLPLQFAQGKEVTTLEGLSPVGRETLHPIQQAWIDENVVQCGYCQPGFMMAAADLLNKNPDPTEEDIKSAITNICRCGTHPRIIKAIKRAAELRQSSPS